MVDFDINPIKTNIPSVTTKVIGVGGAGINIVESIVDLDLSGIKCIVANTDLQDLEASRAPIKVQLGVKSSKGLGAGANPEEGRRATEEDIDKIMDAVEGADIVFLIGGMGGGTGSGGLPVIAQSLRERGILSIVIVTKPFVFEGKRRAACAQAAIDQLESIADTLIVMPNQNLLAAVAKEVSMMDAFTLINDVLGMTVKSIIDIIARHGYINVDFSDVRAIMKDRGFAVMGTGRASGEGRAARAALDAISSPFFENMSIEGAHGVLFNISGGSSLGLHEIGEAASIVYERAHEDANIILGSVVDESLRDEIVVTVIATGFTDRGKRAVLPKEVMNEDKRVDRERNASTAYAVNHDRLREERSFQLAEEQIDLDIPTFMRNKMRQKGSSSL